MNQPLNTFRISVLVLLCISCSTLTMAEERLFPQVFSLPILFFSFVMVDRLNRFSLNNTVAAIAGVVAMIAALLELTIDDPLSKVFFASHMITYLLWIVLLQRKVPRNYWWLIALSAMQIALSSILTKSIWFGVGIFLYVFVILWTLSIFSVYRASLRVQAAAGGRSTSQKKTNSQTATLMQASMTPMQRAQMILNPRASSSRGSIHLDPGEEWLSMRLITGLFITSLMAIAVGMFFFTLIPRIWLNSVEFPSSSGDGVPIFQPRTGYSEEVKLGDIGEVLKSYEKALTVEAYDDNTEEPVDVFTVFNELGYPEPLFRGSVLEEYRGKGEWARFDKIRQHGPPFSKHYNEKYKLVITREDLGTPNLFSVRPGYVGFTTVDTRKEIEEHRNSEVVQMKNNKKHEVVSYNLFIPKNHRQKLRNEDKKTHNLPSFQPSEDLLNPLDQRSTLFNDYVRTIQTLYPEDELKELVNFTRNLVRQEEERVNQILSPIQRAIFLERHLRDSGQYTYTLDLSIVDPTIDPVEDFMFNRKTGNCEYYAATLTLMLRMVGVSSRLVNGYKGGSVKKETEKFTVEQLHAHAWVEAYDPDRKEWIILDPTPALARAASVAEIAANSNSFGSLTSWLDSTWRKNFVSVNLEAQNATIYEPIANRVMFIWSAMTGVRDSTLQLKDFLFDLFSDPSKLFSVTGGITVFVILLALSAIVWCIRRLARLAIGISINRRKRELLKRKSVAFYERFLKIIRSQRYSRKASQTQQEFADHVTEHLTLRGLPLDNSQIPQPVTEAFYRIRFGGETIDESESIRLNSMLDEFEHSLKEPTLAKR